VRIRNVVSALLVVFAAPPVASAQSVNDVLTFLVKNESVPTGSIERDQAAAQATSDTISRALLATLATMPVPTSSSAFVYRLNPELGTVQRATQTFGPFFVERALTAGSHQASFGITFQHLQFDRLDGAKLHDGTLVTTANQFTDEAEPFDVDRLTLNISADVTTLYGNVGLTNRVEVGFAAPMVALQLNGRRVNTYRGRTFTQATASATAIGLADVLVRTKVTMFEEEGAGIAAAVDVRLPTGKTEDLLGAGTPSMKVAAIGSIESGPVSTHANAGVTVGGLARELSYGGAVAVAASPRVTLSGELLGRWLDSFSTIVSSTAPHPTIAGVETIRLTPAASALNIMTFVPGLKWNLTDTWVLAANVTIPLTTGGLTSPFTPFVGIDYAFGR
jgi:hypothetical protein